MSVIVYSTPACPWCTRVKDYLRREKIKFIEVNVAADTNAAFEMVRKSGQRSVPVIDINGNIVLGFNKAVIDRLIH